MKSTKWLVCAAVICLLLPAMARAQGANPVSAAAQEVAVQYGKNLTGAIEAMPADKFSFSPTPAQMSYGKLAEHMQEFNNFACSRLTNAPMPQTKVKDTDSKQTLLAAFKESMDYCLQAFSKLQDSKMGNMVAWYGGRQVTVATVVFSLTDDWYDHYSQAAIYLRLNGQLPPTAQPKK